MLCLVVLITTRCVVVVICNVVCTCCKLKCCVIVLLYNAACNCSRSKIFILIYSFVQHFHVEYTCSIINGHI